MTIRQALEQATAQLATAAHLRDTARMDATLLLMHTAGLSRSELIAWPERELEPAHIAAFDAAIARRLRHEPVQYIIGRQEFYGLDLAVTPAVLIPRPETELLVEAVLTRLPHDQPVRIVDVGTGSGAIAIALAAHLPLAQVTALDLSPAALAVAQANAQAHGLGGRIHLLHSDLLAALADRTGLDAIVSNPPYIPPGDRHDLHPQVREHEPASALFAEEEGLAIYRRLIPQAAAALRPGGLLAMEFGYGQREALAALLAAWDEIAFLDDLQGIPRVALARHR